MTTEPKAATPYARRVTPDSSVWYLGNLVGFLAGSTDTAGRFTLMEILSPKGAIPPRHIHRRDDEAFYVLEGEVTWYVGDETYRTGPGSFVFAPRDVPHSFTIETETVRMLAFLAPAGLEEHFRKPAFGEPAATTALPPPLEGPPDVAALAADLAGYGVEVVGPPGPPVKA